MKPRVTILNGSFDPLTEAETVAAVFQTLQSGKRGWLCTVNVATLMTMRKDRLLQSFADRASFVVADGQPLVWCAPLFRGRLPERIAGIDLMESLCSRAAAEKKGVYLLGATPGLLKKTVEALRQRHPGLRIAGSDGYFPAEAAGQRAAHIRNSGASLLFVGMGSPRQEAFIAEHWDKLGVGMAIGVGGSFDVLGGARFRAHPAIRQAGLEWLVRLAQEPGRLLPRYLATNSLFCLLIGDAIAGRLKRWITAN